MERHQIAALVNECRLAFRQGGMIVVDQPYGPLDEPRRLGPSEYDDDDLGWAGRGDLGASKGRQLTGGELAAKLRKDADAAMARQFGPND